MWKSPLKLQSGSRKCGSEKASPPISDSQRSNDQHSLNSLHAPREFDLTILPRADPEDGHSGEV
jgi:hypothetical protein